MKFKNEYTFLPLLLLIFLVSPFVWAQNQQSNCGKLQMNYGETGGKSLHFPADFDQSGISNNGNMGFMARDWTDENGAFTPKAYEFDMFPASSKKIVKYPYATIVVDGVDITVPEEYESVDPDLIADQMIEMQYISSIGVRVVERAYSFSHPDYQDGSISHYMIINTGEADELDGVDIPGQTLTDLHLVLGPWQIHPGHNVPDRHHPGVYSHWMDFYGDEAGDSLQLFYGWDGDDPKNGDFEDEGNPSIDTGEFLAPYYGGVGLIYADNSVADRTHDAAKFVAGFRAGTYDYNAITEDQMFDNLSTPGSFPPAIDADVPGADPRFEQHPTVYMSVGPWDMAFGDTINVVIFHGVGARSTEECRIEGAKYKSGEITDEQKNEFLRWGKTDLFHKMSKFTQLWNNDLQLPDGFNLTPPSSFTLDKGPGLATLSWSSVPGAASYNLYRALGVQDSTIFSILKPGMTETNYVDEDVNKGFNYYYNLTAVDANGVESSFYWLRTMRKSVVPFAEQGESLDDVRVVPNPFVYDKSGKTNYVGQKDKMMFAGLPGPCKITIYSESGDLIDEIDHPSQEGTHEWFGITRFNQFVASGIYVYHVESTEGKGSVMGKFVIIR